MSSEEKPDDDNILKILDLGFASEQANCYFLPGKIRKFLHTGHCVD
jgi:hypothetical protein